MRAIVPIIIIAVTVLILYRIIASTSKKLLILDVQRKISEILTLIHYYDSKCADVEKYHMYLYSAYHMFVASLLGYKKVQNINPNTVIRIQEYSLEGNISLGAAMGRLMPEIQKRIENLPEPYKKEVFMKIRMDADGTVRTEVNLLEKLQNMYKGIDFNKLKSDHVDSFILISYPEY